MAYAIKLAVAWRRGACEALLFAASSLRAASPAIAAPLPSSWGLAGRCLLSPLPLYCPLLCTRGARCTCHFVPVHAALSAPQRALLLPPTAWRSPREISRPPEPHILPSEVMCSGAAPSMVASPLGAGFDVVSSKGLDAREALLKAPPSGPPDVQPSLLASGQASLQPDPGSGWHTQ
jgi:hypothetical protein